MTKHCLDFNLFGILDISFREFWRFQEPPKTIKQLNECVTKVY